MLRRAFRLPYLPIWVLPLLLFSPVILTGKSLFWGTPALQFLPWRAWSWETLTAGHLPLWNPLVGMGAPLIANYQSGFFYPPNWVYFILGAIGGLPAMAWGQALLVVIHLVFAGLGMAMLMDRLNFGVLAQTVSGLAFSLSGYTVARAGFLSINAAVAWVPWVILGTTQVVQVNLTPSPLPGKRRRGTFPTLLLWANRIFSPPLLGLAIVVGMQLLAGHAQTTWYTLILAAAWGGYLALNGKRVLLFDSKETSAGTARAFNRMPISRRVQPSRGQGIVEPGGQQQAEREISTSVPGFASVPGRADGNGWHGKLTYHQIKEKSNGHNLVTRPASWWKRLSLRGLSRAGQAIRRLLETDWKGAGRRLSKIWIVLGIGLVISAGLAAIQLLPTAEYLLLSQRASAYDFERAMTYSFWPWRLLTLVAPGMFGNPAAGDYWGYGFYWEDAIYIGLLPFLLAISTLVTRRKGKQLRRLVLFLVGIILISFLLALGKNTPVFPWLYKHIPTFDMFQAPTRLTLWAVFALALLAGIGAEMWRRPEGKSLYWIRLGVMGAFAVSLGAAAAGYLIKDIRPSFVRATTLASTFALGAGALTLLTPKKDSAIKGDKRQVWTWAVVLLVSVDLIIAGWAMNPGVSSEFYTMESPAIQNVRSMVGDGRIYLSPTDEYSLKFDRFLLADRFQTDPSDVNWEAFRESLLPNLNMLAGIASANNFDPLLPGRYTVWMDALQSADPGLRESLLDLMGVKVVERVQSPAGFTTDKANGNLASGEDYGQAVSSDGNSIKPLTFDFEPRMTAEAAGRARWIACWQVAKTPEESLEKVFSGELNLQSEVVVEESGSLIREHCSSSSTADVKILDETPNRMDIDIMTDADGYLVLSDVWYPGWQARIDGNPAPVLKADYLFQAVPVAQGNHRIRLEYRPMWFYLGVVVSLLTWIGILIYFTRVHKVW